MNENTSNAVPPAEPASGELPPGSEAADTAGTVPEEKRKSASRTLVLWLAVIVVAGALGAAGLWYFTQAAREDLPDPNDELVASLSASLEATRQAVDALDARIGELDGKGSGRDQRFQAIEDQFADRLRQLESLPGRVGNLEGSMASLRGISSGLRDSWLLAEAEYYMQIANAQLQLASNPKLATLALQLADEKILQLANPALTDIRRALADELRALQSIDTPDIEGIALTLSSLAAVVDSLPLDEDIDASDKDDAADEAIDEELSGMDRMLASLQKTASGIVSVRRSDEAVRPLIAPEAQYFLRANLALQFQAARIALLRGEQTLFDQSLDDAATWLNEYYDANSAAVLSALQTIGEARQSVLPVSLPDISGSLRLLREYRVLSTAQKEAPVEIGEPAADEATQ